MHLKKQTLNIAAQMHLKKLKLVALLCFLFDNQVEVCRANFSWILVAVLKWKPLYWIDSMISSAPVPCCLNQSREVPNQQTVAFLTVTCSSQFVWTENYTKRHGYHPKYLDFFLKKKLWLHMPFISEQKFAMATFPRWWSSYFCSYGHHCWNLG